MSEKHDKIGEIVTRYKDRENLTNEEMLGEINRILKPFDSYSIPNISYWVNGQRLPDDWKFKHIREHTLPAHWLHQMATEILDVLNPAMIQKAA